MTEPLVALLHLSDSLFPIGSFSHSDGLEAATSSGQVRLPADLEQWMAATLTVPLQGVEGPALIAAHRAFSRHQLGVLAELDDEVFALRPSAAGRDASRAMGGRLLRTWVRIRPHERVAAVAAARDTWTLPVAFGVVTSASVIGVSPAVAAFLYTRLAGTVSAAMRLMPIGQHEAHAILARMLERVAPIVADMTADSEEIGFRSFAPALDIAAMSQQYGHSRLFRS